MSKKKHYNNRGNNRGGGYAGKSNHTGAKLIAAIALLLAVAYVITSLALGMQWNPLKWGKDKNVPVDAIGVDENVIAIDSDGNELIAGEVYNFPAGIMFMTSKTTTTPSVTVKAIIKPENADDKRLTWTTSNPDVVTVTPDTVNPLIATITCLNGLTFGVEYVTCTSVENPAARATCQIDYLARGSDVELSGSLEGNPSELEFGKSYTVSAYFSTVTPGTGTVLGEVSNLSWSLNLKSDFMSVVDGYLAKSGYTGNDYALSWNDGSFDIDGSVGSLYTSPYRCFYGGDCSQEVFDNAFKLAMRDCNYHATLSILADYVYNGKVYGRSYSYETEVTFSLSGIWIGVEDLELDNDNVIFGT